MNTKETSTKDGAADMDEEQAKRDAAFEEIKKLRRSIPDLDYDAELAAWREEKFGK